MPTDPAELTTAWCDARRTKDATAIERMIAASPVLKGSFVRECRNARAMVKRPSSRTRRFSAVILSCVVVFGCVAPGRVRVHGGLRAMFHEGQTGGHVTLATLLPNPNLYALGALADLSGEVTVVGGKAYLAYPDGADATRTEVTLETNAAATLLVVSEVPAWHVIVTERPIQFEELDEEISKVATAAGMNLDERFPFLMEGTFDDLQWHVIDGRRLTAGAASHREHLAAAVKTRVDRATAILLGFYSESDEGVFTHMGSKTHIHCALDEPLSTGHVDHVNIPVGTSIKFPARGK
jgi:alpha-acetolactate decarboxylase